MLCFGESEERRQVGVNLVKQSYKKRRARYQRAYKAAEKHLRATGAAAQEILQREFEVVERIYPTNSDNESAMPPIASYLPLYNPSTFSYQFEPLRERVCLPLPS